MKTYREISLESFEFWSGAKANAAMLTRDELNYFDQVLEDIYPDGIDETSLNDLMSFDFDFVCESIGLQYDAENDEVIRD